MHRRPWAKPRPLPESNDPQRPPKGRGSVSHPPNIAPGGTGKEPGTYEDES